ncbi:MAG TPA: hypothetical protein VFP19_10040, partial [Candidatus Limnocylindrales bacterium]|nr:hypothetical protein [Candidatus Limnocylindrales bacterium]
LAAGLLAAGLIADPLPGPAVLGVRLTAALLAAALLRASGPADPQRRRAEEPDAEHRSQLGWPAEAFLFAAGAVAGLAVAAGLAAFAPVTGTGAAGSPSLLPGSVTSPESIGLAVASGLAAISMAAVVAGRGLRRASGAVLLVQAVILARVALGGAPEVLEEIALGVLLVAAAAAAGLLASAGRAAVVQGLRQA